MKAHRNHGMRQSPTEAEDWVCLDVQLLKDSRNFRGKGLWLFSGLCSRHITHLAVWSEC